MIITEIDHQYRLVTQNEHASLVGEFGEHWGNERFDRPNPRSAFIIAAYYHDIGWRDYDLQPRVSDDGPRDFRDSPPELWKQFYRDGINQVTELNSYAGLLVSLHGAGLRRKRYWTHPEMPERDPNYDDFVNREHKRQRQLFAELQGSSQYGSHVSEADEEILRAVHGDGTIEETAVNSRLWFHYTLLQLLDRLSLTICTNGTPQRATIKPAPVGLGKPPTELHLEPVDPTTVSVEPYPFDISPLPVPLRYRMIEKRDYEESETLVSDYFEAGRNHVEVTFTT